MPAFEQHPWRAKSKLWVWEPRKSTQWRRIQEQNFCSQLKIVLFPFEYSYFTSQILFPWKRSENLQWKNWMADYSLQRYSWFNHGESYSWIMGAHENKQKFCIWYSREQYTCCWVQRKAFWIFNETTQEQVKPFIINLHWRNPTSFIWKLVFLPRSVEEECERWSCSLPKSDSHQWLSMVIYWS